MPTVGHKRVWGDIDSVRWSGGVRSSRLKVSVDCDVPASGMQAVMVLAQVLTWNSHHIDERIKDASAAVKDLQELQALVQGTSKQAADLAADWAAHSLLEFKEGQVGMRTCSNKCWLNFFTEMDCSLQALAEPLQ